MKQVVMAIFVALWATASFCEPYRPSDDSIVLERLPTMAFDAEAAELKRLRKRLETHPEDIGLALDLATRLIEIGRQHDDPRYYGYAQAALSPWWNLANPPPNILVLRATLKQNRHEFESALADLEAALKADPRNAQAWLTRATILQVQGSFDEARTSCQPLFQLAQIALSLMCSASIDALTGNSAQARDRFEALLELELAPELEIWALTELAETAARLNEHKTAQRYFERALALRPGDAYLLANYSAYLLQHGEAKTVIEMLQGFERVDRLLLRLALAEMKLDAPALEPHLDELARRFAAANARSPDAMLHAGEEARYRLYLLGEADEALKLAQQNWRLQREPRDILILLEAALAAESKRAAEPALVFLRQTRLEDRELARLAAAIKALPE